MSVYRELDIVANLTSFSMSLNLYHVIYALSLMYTTNADRSARIFVI